MLADYIRGDENALPPDPVYDSILPPPPRIDIERWRRIGIKACAWLFLCFLFSQMRPLEDEYGRFETNFAAQRLEIMENTWTPILNLYPDYIQKDKSYNRRPSKRRFFDHHLFTLGYQEFKVDGRLYDHWYLGIFGTFIPLPYLPRMKNGKSGLFGLCIPPGVCSVAHIVYSKEFRDDDLVTLLIGPTILLFLLWQWPGWWTTMFKHTTFSIPNFKQGRWHILFLAPLSQRTWSSALHQLFVLGYAIGDTNSVALIMTYFGACFFTWLIMYIWKPNDNRASFGGSAGATALLVCDCFLRPHLTRGMGLPVGPSIPMSSKQMLVVHSFLHWGPELFPAACWGAWMSYCISKH